MFYTEITTVLPDETMLTFPQIYPITCHTDHVGPGTTFIAIKGMKENGIHYIQEALARGANRIVLEKGTILPDELQEQIKKAAADVVYVDAPRRALAELSAEAHGYPARSLKLIAITGTKGKTTTSFILEHILRTAGFKTALLSTVKNRILEHSFDAPLTTAQPDYLHTFFALCRDQGVEYVVMEVAAQALSLERVATLSFDAAVFTNFSLEHSEFYQSQDDYFKAKCSLFNQVKPQGNVIVNADDPALRSYLDTSHLDALPTKTFGLHMPASFTAQITRNDLNGLRFLVNYQNKELVLSSKTLLGEFSVLNIVAALAVIDTFGIEWNYVQRALETFEGVPGRLQRFELPNGSIAFIDTAHTPSSFEALLSTLRPLSSHIISVFGAGGDRDPIKRPLMGALAVQFSDTVIITTDNPRSEDPQYISDAIIAGVKTEDRHKIFCELDRERAIRLAYQLSKPNSIIALLGKGPVEYQHIRDRKTYFSEAAILRSF